MWDLTGPGLKPASPALADRLTTGADHWTTKEIPEILLFRDLSLFPCLLIIDLFYTFEHMDIYFIFGL